MVHSQEKLHEIRVRLAKLKIKSIFRTPHRKQYIQRAIGLKRLADRRTGASQSNRITKIPFVEMNNKPPENESIPQKLIGNPGHSLIFEWTRSPIFIGIRANMLNRKESARETVERIDQIIKTQPVIKNNMVVYTGHTFNVYKLKEQGRFIGSNSLERLPIPTSPHMCIAFAHTDPRRVSTEPGCIFAILLTNGTHVLDVNKYLAEVHVESAWSIEDEMLLPSGGKLFEVSREYFEGPVGRHTVTVINCLYVKRKEYAQEISLSSYHINPSVDDINRARAFFRKLSPAETRFEETMKTVCTDGF